MKTLVTGATGFVGSAIVRHLVGTGHNVRALVRPGSDPRNLKGFDCETVTGDLTDFNSLKRAVNGCEAVFHAAADYRLWVRDAGRMHQVNVAGTKALLQAAAAAGVSRVVYTSSVATLRPGKNGLSADERSIADLSEMIGAYKRSKFLAEQEVIALVAKERLPVVTVKPTAPFGPGDLKPTPTGRIVIEAASGRMPAFVNTGLNVVHVDDVAAGHLLAYEKGAIGESYILGGENHSLQWILETVTRLAGQRPPRIRLPHWAVLPVACVCEGMARLGVLKEPLITLDGLRMARKLMYFSSDKARAKLGYLPRPATEALADAVDWYSRNGYISESPDQVTKPETITETTDER